MRMAASSKVSVAVFKLLPSKRKMRSRKSLRSSKIKMTNSNTMPAVAMGLAIANSQVVTSSIGPD